MHSRFFLRSTTEDDWRKLRQFRLENARAHPISYGATLATTLQFDEEAWRMRARRGDQTDTASYVAIEAATGRWVGMMACQTGDDDGPEPVLTGVYVTEDFRGRAFGIADALLDQIVTWAATSSACLRLWVYEGSEPARRFYSRRGFVETGKTRPMLLEPPGGSLVELARPLGSGYK